MKAVLILLVLMAFPAEGADRTVRSAKAKADFAKLHACPATGRTKLPCPGYIIDHRRPLDCGGSDTPANMQWLTVPVWRAKSKWERSHTLCEYRTRGTPPAGTLPWWKQ